MRELNPERDFPPRTTNERLVLHPGDDAAALPYILRPNLRPNTRYQREA